MTKNMIWDVDGTLFDTYPAVTYSFSKALNELGFSVALNVIDSLVRQSFEQCVDVLSHRFKLDPDLLQQKFAESYGTISLTSQLPFSGVRDVCQLIHQTGGLNVIVTNRGISFTRELLAVHRLSQLFDGIISAAQGYPQKPDPAMVLAALEKHKMNPTTTLLIGNHAMDIEAGASAGVRTCLFGKAETTVAADIQIEKYGQLLSLLIHEAGKRSERSYTNEK